MISAWCVSRDLHTVAPGPLERTCWRRFAALWGDYKKSRIAPLNAIIIIIIIIGSQSLIPLPPLPRKLGQFLLKEADLRRLLMSDLCGYLNFSHLGFDYLILDFKSTAGTFTVYYFIKRGGGGVISKPRLDGGREQAAPEGNIWYRQCSKCMEPRQCMICFFKTSQQLCVLSRWSERKHLPSALKSMWQQKWRTLFTLSNKSM